MACKGCQQEEETNIKFEVAKKALEYAHVTSLEAQRQLDHERAVIANYIRNGDEVTELEKQLLEVDPLVYTKDNIMSYAEIVYTFLKSKLDLEEDHNH